jgi:hypothetical protein
MKTGGSLSIWFFTGICLGVNGLLIFATGIYEALYPPANKVVLFNLHANIWWGAVLLLLGLFFAVHFSPSRERARMAGNS